MPNIPDDSPDDASYLASSSSHSDDSEYHDMDEGEEGIAGPAMSIPLLDDLMDIFLDADDVDEIISDDNYDENEEDACPDSWAQPSPPSSAAAPLNPREYRDTPGRNVMFSGTFAPSLTSPRAPSIPPHAYVPPPLTCRLRDRELGLRRASRYHLVHDLIPGMPSPTTTTGYVCVKADARAYSGQFSDDGSMFFAAMQDFTVRLYDTTDATRWRLYKTVRSDVGRWTVTDAALSLDRRWLAFTTIAPTVQLATTVPEDDTSILLDFRTRALDDFGLWSVRFSGDGREIVAGGSDDCIYVYDVERRKVVVRLAGHIDDVNAVCFAEPKSTHVLFSGSDDGYVKVWDRRSMRSTAAASSRTTRWKSAGPDRARPAGVLAGHTEGVTYVASALEEGGRYCASNAKDQTLKLWDIRKMLASTAFDAASNHSRLDLRERGFDYRWARYPHRPGAKRHPLDCSVTTFTGHSVLRTLIRCHFSPPATTGRRYVYSGSEDGVVRVWDLDGELVAALNTAPIVNGASEAGSPAEDELGSEGDQHTMAIHDLFRRIIGATRRRYNSRHVRPLVRDVSWHPTAQVLAATAWMGTEGWEGEGGVVLFGADKRGATKSVDDSDWLASPLTSMQEKSINRKSRRSSNAERGTSSAMRSRLRPRMQRP